MSTGPLPIVVGVVGHRDLRPEDIPALERKVRDFLEQLKKDYQNTTLVFLSALAEGADRLGARVALDLHYRLIVPLPLPKEEFLRDFETAESKAEFESLLGKAERSFALQLPEPLLEPSALATSAEETRNLHYAMCGAYLARHSQILLALWDGVDSGKVGGTAQVVRFKREGIPPPFSSPRSPLDPVEGGPVYHLLTPRQCNPRPSHAPAPREPGAGVPDAPWAAITQGPAPAPRGGQLAMVPSVAQGPAATLRGGQPAMAPSGGQGPAAEPSTPGVPFDMVPLYPPGHQTDKQASRRHAEIFRNMDDYNRDAVGLGEPGVEYPLLPAEAARLQSVSIQATNRRFEVADALAKRYQRRAYWTFAISLLVGACAALLIQLYALLGARPQWLVIAYGSLLGIVVVLYIVIRKGRFNDKHLDYRALAEGLRVDFFWRVSGLRKVVAELYLRKQRSELDWIRQALRAWNIPARIALEVETPLSKAQLELVWTHWVVDQARFFVKACNRDTRWHRWLDMISKGAFLAGLTMALVKLLLEPDNPLLMVMTFALLLAGFLHIYGRNMAYSEHARQYLRMTKLFDKGMSQIRQLLDEGNLSAAQSIVTDLGQEALMENGDWLLLHRGLRRELPVRGG